MNRGAKAQIKTASKKNRRNRSRRNKGNATTAKLADAARIAAMRRLRDIHPDLYGILYDEERVRRGLPPLIKREPVNFNAVVEETLTFDEVYDVIDRLGATNA